MLTNLRNLCILALTFLPIFVLGQSGPGGVSNDGNSIQNCRLWLNAGDLAPVGDGNYVYAWQDKSNSLPDSAFWLDHYQVNFDAPLYRSDPAYSINGKPVISFENGGMLLMGLNPNDKSQNPDLSADVGDPAPKRTVFVAFRTGNNITSRQYLWEQGGGWKGMGMYISNSYFYIGVYSLPSGDGDPFGYCYKKAPVQPNTTYVVSLVLDAPTDGTLNTDITNNTALRGTINGGSFGILEQGASKPSLTGNGFGVGSIGAQGDPIGIGGVNSLAADEVSINDWQSAGNPCVGFTPCNNTLLKTDSGQTGQFTFKGRIAEICYYAYSLNDAERIIVENYLAAKYFANVIANDKYEYQTNYGNDVIGIGAEANGDEHNNSKGDNLFEISVDDMDLAFKYNSQSHYLLVGHNGNPLQWINQNTPDTATVERLRRTWRFDRDGSSNTPFTGDANVKIKFNAADLPTLPGTEYKLAVLIDDSNGPLPNFSSSSRLIEIPGSGGVYDGQFIIHDGSYFTIAAVKPTIQFKQNTAYTLETDDSNPTIAGVDVELNYTPLQSTDINTGVLFESVTAQNPGDYTAPNTAITITPPSRTGSVSFNIINEDIVDTYPVLEFLIVIDQSATDAGYFIGKRDTLTYKIYDDDPEPKATFLTATNDTITETGNGGTGKAQIDVRINGTTTSSQDRTLRIINNTSSQSATYGVDYTLANADDWGTLQDGRRYKDVTVFHGTNETTSLFFDVFTDNLDEDNESINFILEPQGDIGTDNSSIIEHTVNLVDINPEPTAEFLSPNSEGFEAVNQPQIIVKLSAPSAKTIEVPFAIVGGTATNDAYYSNGDYSADSLGTLIFEPGDTLSYLYYYPGTNGVTLAVYADNTLETDETIDFELREPVINAQLGTQTDHTYTIKDYKPFEFEGVAGVGMARDNIFWVKLDQATSGQSGNIPQLSPRPININQATSAYQPSVVVGKNDQKVIDFSQNSNSMLAVSGSSSGKSPFVNTAGFYDSKDIFFMVTLPPTSTNNPRIIFEEGGENKGLNIYLKNDKIYFQAWNTSDDDGTGGTLAPWGGNDSYAVSNSLTFGESYVVSCHYDDAATHPLRIYVNGELQGTYGSTIPGNSDYIGRLYVHSAKAAIGGLYNDSRFDTGPVGNTYGYNFQGQIGEMIYYNNQGDEMNTARIRILHNYFSARFNIPLTTGQVFDLIYADQTNATPGYVAYNKDVAGIGTFGTGNVHGVAQGPAQMKVSGSDLSGTDTFILWGHNDVPFTDTWPYSYWNASLPEDVKERSGRVWRFSENFSGNENLKIEMNFSESDNATEITNDRGNLLRLLVSSDADDWSGATVYTPAATQPDIDEGARVVFDNVLISDGDYVSLGNTSSINVFPLPIELLSFNAKFQFDHVNIAWSTASEVNNDHFEIERAGSDLAWKKIADVAGAGNSNTTIYYTEKDRNPLPGVSYYRLKQVDFDGNFTYSDVVSVVNASASAKNEVVLYPNPSLNGSFNLQFSNPDKFEKANVSIFSASGKLVYQSNIEPNDAIIHINHGNLPAGIYAVQISNSLFQNTKKLVVK